MKKYPLYTIFISALLAALLLSGCQTSPSGAQPSSSSASLFDETSDSQPSEWTAAVDSSEEAFEAADRQDKPSSDQSQPASSQSSGSPGTVAGKDSAQGEKPSQNPSSSHPASGGGNAATSSAPSKPTAPSKPDTSGTIEPSSGSPSVPSSSGSETQEVFALVNQRRTENGLAALRYRSDLQSAADLRAKEIVSRFSHTRPNGSNFYTAITESGVSYRAAGENIAYGQRTAESVMTGWMNSQGHRNNILSESYTGMAVGLYEQGGIKYWVQLFVK